MDERMDKFTRDVLLEALADAMEYHQQWEYRREQSLWKETAMPAALSVTLSRLTKEELVNIRKNLGLKNLSSLKKDELVNALTERIPLAIEKITRLLDKERHNLLKKIVKNAGYVPENGLDMSKIESLMGYGIVFPGVYKGRRVLFMPVELLREYSRLDGDELREVVRRNTEWIKMTHGMLYYYGVMSPWQMKTMLEQLIKQEIDIMEYIKVISAAVGYYGQISYSEIGYQDSRVFNDREIINEHNMRPGVEFYPFTRQQLIKAGEPDYLDKTPTVIRLYDFLMKHYELTGAEANEIIREVVDRIKIDSRPTAPVEYLQTKLEIPSFEVLQQLTARLMELHNETRMWVLKGHTPKELSAEKKKDSKPLPDAPFMHNPEVSNVFDIKTGAKVGRNDPCPCGSGKKYKKCCGR